MDRIYRAYAQSTKRQRAWAADNPGNQAIRGEIRERLLEHAGSKLRTAGRTLDVGCGTGFWLEELRQLGVPAAQLTGAEILPDRVKAATARLPGVAVAQADARKLPFDDGSFDVVLAFTILSSLESSDDVHRALLEARRVLAPSGILVVYEPRWANPFNRQVRGISHREFDQADLRVQESVTLTLIPQLARRLGRATSPLYPRLASVSLLRTHRLVVCAARAGRETR